MVQIAVRANGRFVLWMGGMGRSLVEAILYLSGKSGARFHHAGRFSRVGRSQVKWPNLAFSYIGTHIKEGNSIGNTRLPMATLSNLAN